ncbi:MAG: hypothetical protein ACI9NC_005173 [Verrucomicrobiales bacterium]
MESLVRRVMAERAKSITVEAAPLPDFSGDKAAPSFQHQEIEALYRHGFDFPNGRIREILALPRESLVVDLETVLQDAIRHGRFFFDDEGATIVEHEIYFPVHAISFLGELGASDSLPLVCEILSQHPDILEMWFGDYLNDALWEPLYYLVAGQFEAAYEFMVSPGVDSTGKIAVIEAIAEQVFQQPDRRDEVVDWLTRVLHFLVESPREDNVLDTEVTLG